MSITKSGEWEPSTFYSKLLKLYPSWNFVCEEKSGEHDIKEFVISIRCWNPSLSSFGVSSVMFGKYNKNKEDEWNTHYSEGVWNLVRVFCNDLRYQTKDGEIQIYNLYSVGHRRYKIVIIDYSEEKGYCDPHFLDMQVMHINPPELNEKDNEEICVMWTDKKFYVEKGEFTSNHPMVTSPEACVMKGGRISRRKA